MVFLHVVMFIYDTSWTSGDLINSAPTLLIVVGVVGLFLGGWCGFFLLVSSVGNMISMQNAYQKGSSVGTVLGKQLITGIILLIFAMLSESVIGYQAWIAAVIKNVATGESVPDILNYLPRSYHMEAIHAVAWAVIINAIVQALLSVNGGWQKTRRNVIIYGILAALVVVGTPLIWSLMQQIVPGYPMGRYPAPYEDIEVKFVIIGVTPWYDYIKLFMMMPFAANPEPMFPFLAVSFLGSIVGIYLTKPDCPRSMPRKGMLVSLFLMVVGFGWLVYLIVDGQVDALKMFQDAWNIPSLGVGWAPMFLLLTGVQFFGLMLVFRLVEFRGKAQEFAAKTIYWRRYGFIAFTIYNFQLVDLIPRFIVWKITGINVFTQWGQADGYLTLAISALTFIVWSLIFWLWEKVHYIGSLEWVMGTLAIPLLSKQKAKKQNMEKQKVPWWKLAALDVKGGLYNIEAINIVPPSEVDHANYADSRLFSKLAVILLFLPPLTILTLILGLKIQKIEVTNPYAKRAVIISSIGIIFTVVMAILLGTMTGLPI